MTRALRLAGALGLVATLLALGSVGLAPPAAARERGLGVSLDGRRWSDHLERSLFSEDRVWVPGDGATVAIWVRNSSGRDVDLSVELGDETRRTRLGSALALTATVDDHPVSGDTPGSYRIGNSPAPVRVVLTVRLPAELSNRTQRQHTRLHLLVTVSEAVVTDRTSPGAGRPGLAATGTGAHLSFALAAGAGLLVGGSLLVRRPHARPETDGEP